MNITKKLKDYKVQLVLLSSVGLIATFWQTAEKIHLLKNPEVPLSCNINPIVDCGVILNHSLSSVFAVPNSMIGMVVFSMLVGAGIMLLTGKKATKNSALFISAMVLAMMAFSIWFYAVSLFSIGKVCIFCVAIWSAVIPLFYLTIRQFDKQLFGRRNSLLKEQREALAKNPHYFIIGTFVLAIAIFLYQFRDYYFG